MSDEVPAPAWEAGDVLQGLLWTTQSLTLAPDDDTELHEAIRLDLAGWRATVPAPRPPLPHPGIVAQAGFTPDGSRLVTLSTGTVRREEQVMPDGTKRTSLIYRPETVGEDPVLGAAMARMGAFNPLLERSSPRHCATPRGRVLLWDLASFKPVDVRLPPDRLVLAVTPDGKTALTVPRQDPSLPSTAQLWGLAEGKALGEAVQFNYPIQAALASGDSKTIITLVAGGLDFWDCTTGHRLNGPMVGRQNAYQAALSPDGTVLALVTAGIFGSSPPTALGEVPRPLIPGMPRGPGLPGMASRPGQATSGEIVLVDLAARKLLARWPLPTHGRAGPAAARARGRRRPA
jgi:hypothetical protein